MLLRHLIHRHALKQTTRCIAAKQQETKRARNVRYCKWRSKPLDLGRVRGLIVALRRLDLDIDLRPGNLSLGRLKKPSLGGIAPVGAVPTHDDVDGTLEQRGEHHRLYTI